jgi:transcriptional activator HAC1
MIDPSSLALSGYAQNYPTPPPMSDDGKESSLPPQDQPQKKKRKAWGQPVPEIKQILPPRKRAKTAEEKEQRKNERILRNRRAADKSRQRQKAAVADLEVRQGRMEQEVQVLRDIVARYQVRFGVQDDFPTPLPVVESTTDSATSTSLESAGTPAQPPYTPMTFTTDDVESGEPTLVPSDNASPFSHESPVLAPQLTLLRPSESTASDLMTSLDGFNPVSGLTQYPAVVLCDLQCQPETWATSLPATSSPLMHQLGMNYLLLLFQWVTIQHTISTTTLYPICQVFRILANRLSTSCLQDSTTILNNFPLIHSLISMPSTPTRPAVFRMKLLSRLLACSPHMARLLLAATERALQQVVSEEGYAADPERRWTWSSLMTIKWTILRLEREHRKIRRQVRERGVPDVEVIKGVDLGAVARSTQLWQGVTASSNCNISVDNCSWTTAQEVH